MKNLSIIIVSSLVLISCTSKDNGSQSKDLKTSKADTGLPKTAEGSSSNYEEFNNSFTIDSAFLLQLEDAYSKGKRIRLPFEESGSEEIYRVVESKLNFTPDTIPDYFVTDYETRFAQSYIIDGRNGRFIPFSHDSLVRMDESSMFWHRPIDRGIVPDEINIDCEDGINELMITYTAGFSGFGSYLMIYRYQEQTDEVNMIFKRTIHENYSSDETGELIRDSLNYIDVLYKLDSCISEIHVFRGQSKKVRNYKFNYSDIEPVENSLVQRYLFNREKSLFELKK